MNLSRVIVRMAAAAALAALSASAAAAQSAWRHGIIEAKSDAGILMMVTRGFAEKQGLKLEILQFKSDAIGLKALLAGEIESYDGALTGTVVAASLGVDVKLLAAIGPGCRTASSCTIRSRRSRTCAARRSRSRRPSRIPT
jgi:NitT/TauT family transport system substrate-binding protein